MINLVTSQLYRLYINYDCEYFISVTEPRGNL